MAEEDAIEALRKDLGVERTSAESTSSQTEPADAAQQVEAIKAEIARLKQSVASIASRTSNLATNQAEVTMSEVEEVLKRNVFASVGVALLLGYVWGRTR